MKILIKNLFKVNALCLLFGHKQYTCHSTNLISCDRCHLVNHFYSFEDNYEDNLFSLSGVVFLPWHWLRNKIESLKYKLKNRKTEDYEDDEIPF